MLDKIIRQSHLFSELDDKLLTEITSSASIKDIKNGQILFDEGGPAHSFFIVISGKVKVFKMSSEGKEQILMIAVPGDSFAEAAMFSGGDFPASAQALEESKVMVIDRLRFLTLLGKNPALAMNLIGRLSELLRKLTLLVEGLSLTDVTSRLAHYLVERAEAEGKAGERPGVLTLTEKKSVLASLLGTIPETLSRSLARLSKEEAIEVRGSEIEVLDIDKLRKIGG